ncbi:site-specific recombinase XerD [Pseudomonas sp. JUb42]|nr:site-specific recombinase XerD [Pseudomonas sp. JUb42]
MTRAHVLAWRAQLEQRGLAGATIRRKLAALASLFDHLLENNAVAGGNPVHGVKRPRIETSEGKTPALGDHQAKVLLNAPDPETLKGKRGKLRYLPLHPVAAERIHGYLEMSRHQLVEAKAPLFVPLRGRSTGAGISANGIYTVVGHYAKVAGIEVAGLGVHGLRATAATNALENDADIAKVQGVAWACQYQ